MDNAQLFGQVRLWPSGQPDGPCKLRHLVDVCKMNLERWGEPTVLFPVLLMDLDRLQGHHDRTGTFAGSHALCRVGHLSPAMPFDLTRRRAYGGRRIPARAPGNRRIGRASKSPIASAIASK